jgi:hypothetical protein
MNFRSTLSQRKALCEQLAALLRVHADIRAQRRGVNWSIPDWLLQYSHHDPLGCELVTFGDGHEVTRLERPALGRKVAEALSVHAGGGSGGSLMLFHKKPFFESHCSLLAASKAPRQFQSPCVRSAARAAPGLLERHLGCGGAPGSSRTCGQTNLLEIQTASPAREA